MLMNFKSDNFSGISTTIPPSLRIWEQKPCSLLNTLLEDFHSCTEIPPEKRPESLFLLGSGEYILRVSSSRLAESKLSEILDSCLSTTRNPPAIVAIDIVWDQSPTCEKMLSILMNITAWRNWEFFGLVAAHGYLYSAFAKHFEQWRGFGDGKISSWVNLVWSLVTGVSYPVMVVLVQGPTKPVSQVFSKIDYECILKFSKLQDQRVKIIYKEEALREVSREIPRENPKDSRSAYAPDPREKIKQYLEENRYNKEEFKTSARPDYKEEFRTSTRPEYKEEIRTSTRAEYKEENRPSSKPDFRSSNLETKLSQEDKPTYYQEEFSQRELRKSMEEVKLMKEQKSSARDYYEEKRSGKPDAIYADDGKRRNDLSKEENRPYAGERSYRDKIYSEKSKDELLKEDPTDFRSSVHDFHSSRGFRDSSRAQNEEPALNVRTRNYSTDPSLHAKPSVRSYQEDNIYSAPRNMSMGPKEAVQRPGILKNASVESSRSSRYSSVQVNQSITPILSPREASGALSRTFRENAYSEKYEEEPTEKPSILKNSWTGEKDYNPRQSRFETEKKVNFSDSVFRIDDSNKDQMPEIKLTSVKIPEKKAPISREYRAEGIKHEAVTDHRPYDYKSSDMKTTNYLAPDYRYSAKVESKSIDTSGSWSCPKCSVSIANTLYECNSCRFINWDKFYALKSKSPKTRSESIPVKSSEREDPGRAYRPLVDSRPPAFESRPSPTKEAWKPRDQGKEIKVQETYISDDYGRRTNRDFLFNR